MGSDRFGSVGRGNPRHGMVRNGSVRTNQTKEKALTTSVKERTSKTILNGNDGTEIEPVSNGGDFTISMSKPYVARVRIQGVVPILFHAWNCESVAEKGAAAKGSAAKKTDDVESYLPRCEDGTAGIPGPYLIGSICDARCGAARYRQDPRSPRKSAIDLYKAAITCLTPVATLGKTTWDYIDKRRVVIQRSAVTRSRPAFLTGWTAEFDLQVLLPEYVSPADLHSVLVDAGRLTGLADFRPTYGRFLVTHFEVVE
jgi:hypothetical protein